MYPRHDQRTYIIAEAGVNHDGSLARARELIGIAKESGADAVKFQLFDPAALTTESAPMAQYQASNLGEAGLSQRAMLEGLALPREAFVSLAEECEKQGIDFLCTPFDEESLYFLVHNTRMPALKLPSGEITNALLLETAAESGLKLILSTGMSSLADIEEALSLLRSRRVGQNIALLHCVSMYPAPAASTHLLAMDTMKQHFGLPVGLSDHTPGIHVAVAAVARGAGIIEKHFTYDPAAHGPDHAASLDPASLKVMVCAIREVEDALGSPEKKCQKEEENTRLVARKSLVAAENILAEEVFTRKNLTAKRPAPEASLSPMRIAALLGKPARKGYKPDQPIDPDELSA